MKLTIEELSNRASLYATRSQFAKHNPSGYKSAKQQGLLDQLYPEKGETPAQLTPEQIKDRASECRNRTEFKVRFDGAFKKARKLGMLDSLFPKPPSKVKPETKPKRPPKLKPERKVRRLTEDVIRSAAKNATSRYDFEKKDKSCCNAARVKGLLKELFPKIKTNFLTTEEFVSRARKVHGQRYDYREARYERTDKKVKIICPEHGVFWQRPQSHLAGRGCAKCWSFDNNAFYLKLAERCVHNGKQVYKVGVTSHRLGNRRLDQQERNSKMKHLTIIPPTLLIGSATDIENFALSLGDNPGYSGFDGSSEYRAYSEDDLLKIKDMVELCSANNQKT